VAVQIGAAYLKWNAIGELELRAADGTFLQQKTGFEWNW
jgi:hypothetical protein